MLPTLPVSVKSPALSPPFNVTLVSGFTAGHVNLVSAESPRKTMHKKNIRSVQFNITRAFQKAEMAISSKTQKQKNKTNKLSIKVASCPNRLIIYITKANESIN